MRAGLLAASAAVLFVAAGAQYGSATPADDKPPLGGTPAPPAGAIKPCASYVTGKAAVVKTSAEAKATICGSQQPDRITATGGAAYIETFGGADYVNAQNRKPDEIWNGSGIDEGLFDSCDRIYDLDEGKKSTAACPGVTSRTKRTPQRRRFPVQLPPLECRGDARGGRRFRFSRLPIVRAIDATSQVDWQNVGWSAFLYERTGTGWELRAQTEWLWDRIYDEQVTGTTGNTWRSFVKNTRRTFSELRRADPGSYRVAIHFKWYGGKGVPDRELRVWAGRLFRALPNRSRC